MSGSELGCVAVRAVSRETSALSRKVGSSADGATTYRLCLTGSPWRDTIGTYVPATR